MKKRTLRSLDINPYIGEAKISGGEIALEIPKLSAIRILEAVKLLGSESAKIWGAVRKIVNDSSYTENEVIMEVLKIIPDHVLPELLSILLDIDQESASQLDLNDILAIIDVYVEETDLKNTFFQIQTIYKKVYGKELPKLSAILPSMEELQKYEEERKAQMAAASQTDQADQEKAKNTDGKMQSIS